MKTNRLFPFTPFVGTGLFILVLLLGAAKISAAESKLDVQLVWGSNGESSPDPNLKPLDASLAKKLGMFKWKKYYQVNRKELVLVDHALQKIRLSPQCQIEVKHLDGSRYEINVFGEGKHVQKITERITSHNPLAIAGDDKNDCAWFILIREL
ncbi:MAG: hypothetical protein ABI042_12575 [Verrucomicrobiota bacterium]